MDDKKIIAIRHFDISDNFFDLVEAVLQETIKQGNSYSPIFRKADLSDIQNEYKQRTKWIDSRIIIPVLFNFFHGIELYLKGAKYLQTEPIGKTNHKLSDYYCEFKTNYSNKSKLIDIFDYYIFPDRKCKILYEFYKTNNLANSSEFYEVFKYPYNIKFTQGFNYKDLRNNEEQGLKFFKQIIVDIETLRDEKKIL